MPGSSGTDDCGVRMYEVAVHFTILAYTVEPHYTEEAEHFSGGFSLIYKFS